MPIRTSVALRLHGVHAVNLKGKAGSVRKTVWEIWQSNIEPVLNTKLTAYNAGEIECSISAGWFHLLCSYRRDYLSRKQIIKNEGQLLNSMQCVINTNDIIFVGSVNGKDVIRPDKIGRHTQDVYPSRQWSETVFGLMNYLASCMPQFVDTLSTLRELLEKDVQFVCNEDHEWPSTTWRDVSAANHVFRTQRETVMEDDASQTGLGTYLLQENKPIAFASKTLTPTH